jgi:hypothetical protein
MFAHGLIDIDITCKFSSYLLIHEYINIPLALGMLIRRENPDLKKMVDTFIYKPEDNSTIPEHILKVLSWSERPFSLL